MAPLSLRLTVEKDGRVSLVRFDSHVVPQIKKSVELLMHDWLIDPARNADRPARSEHIVNLTVFCSPVPIEAPSCYIMNSRQR
jgi:hypothetical protein